MTTKKLLKLARANGWVLHRTGSRHFIYRRKDQTITIPFQVRGFVGQNISKSLVKI